MKEGLVIALISDTGMRLSEALGLVWSDVRA
jgi:integrase